MLKMNIGYNGVSRELKKFTVKEKMISYPLLER
jgi:hypothetical protein